MRNKSVLLLLLTMACIHCAQAGGYVGVVKPWLYGTSVYLDVSGTQMSGRPACATRNYMRLQESDPNDPWFKLKLSMLLAAWVAEKPVSLSGTGACSGEGDEWIFAVIGG